MRDPGAFSLFKALLTGIVLIGQMAGAQDTARYGTPFERVPDPREAVIYQVNMRSFSSTRDLQGVISRLDHIRDLGANVIYLMPTYPIGSLKSINSPYCIKDYLDVNPELGTLADLRALINEAHHRGMAVILDWVANHTSWDHDWIYSHPEWYEQDGSGNIQSPSLGWTDVAQLKFSSSGMRLAMIDAMKYWVYAANCDGFRFDYADGPPADFWEQAIDSLRNIKTHRLLLLAEGGRSDHFASGFDYKFGFGFWNKMRDIFRLNAAVTGIDQIISGEYAGASDSNRVAHYTSNHDVNSDGTPLEWFGGKTGSMAAFVSTAYIKGVPFIYNGQEVGYPDPIQFLNTSSLIDWSLNPGMVEEYKRIIAFYNSSSALKKGNLTSHHTSDICAFERIFENDTVLVVVNLRNNSSSFNWPEGYANTRMYDAFTSEATDLETGIALSAYAYRVYTDSGAVIPVAGLTLNSEAETMVAGSSKQLFATVTPTDATYKSVTWYSSDTTLAVVNEIGVVRGISPGTLFITGRNADQSHADTCLVTITGIAVSGINIIQEQDSVIAGNTLQPAYTIQPDDATNRSVRWKSGNTGIVSVNESGTVQGIAAGSAFVYVETEDGAKRDSIEMIVKPGNEFTVYFSKPANWASSIKIYYWDPQPTGILPVVYWPGVDMTLSGGWYAYTFTGISSTNLIFNDKTKQTGNLSRNRDGWYKNDTWYNSNPDPVAIHEERLNSFTIYPNPVEDGRFTVGLPSLENKAILKIVDLQGGIVFKTELAGFQTTLDVPFLLNGIYLVLVTGDSCTHFQKIYIQ